MFSVRLFASTPLGGPPERIADCHSCVRAQARRLLSFRARKPDPCKESSISNCELHVRKSSSGASKASTARNARRTGSVPSLGKNVLRHMRKTASRRKRRADFAGKRKRHLSETGSKRNGISAKTASQRHLARKTGATPLAVQILILQPPVHAILNSHAQGQYRGYRR